MAFLGLGIGAYAGGLLPLSALLATVLVIPLYMVYSRMSADMARSGGDYVWTSRIFGPGFGPPIGFMVAWTWIILAFTAIGAPAAFFAQLGVAGWMRSMAVATGTRLQLRRDLGERASRDPSSSAPSCCCSSPWC